jgi:hypothetical protein
VVAGVLMLRGATKMTHLRKTWNIFLAVISVAGITIGAFYPVMYDVHRMVLLVSSWGMLIFVYIELNTDKIIRATKKMLDEEDTTEADEIVYIQKIKSENHAGIESRGLQHSIGYGDRQPISR